MIEKITPNHILGIPNKHLVKYISELDTKNIVYYEIGIGIGSTTLEVSKILNNQGKIYLFSKQCDCEELKNDLNKLGYNNINTNHCSDTKIYSGYHFDMAMGIMDNKLPHFDVAYLDGGHVFHLDAPTTCMLKELCKINGVIFFDDYNWTINYSPTLNPKIRPKTLIEYDKKQINLKHVQIICKIFMDTDSRYRMIVNNTKCVAYKRIQ